MPRAPLARLHWRLRGAWMWPLFIILTVVDGVLLHVLPVVGDAIALPGALILAVIINLIAITVLGPTLGALVRRWRGDMPQVVSSDYAGAFGVVAVTVVIAAGGVIHHHVVTQDRTAQTDALLIARRYIAAHAPDAGAYDLRTLDLFELEPPARSRICAHQRLGSRWYCVAVTVPIGAERVPGANFHGARVSYAGTESNELLSEGTG